MSKKYKIYSFKLFLVIKLSFFYFKFIFILKAFCLDIKNYLKSKFISNNSVEDSVNVSWYNGFYHINIFIEEKIDKLSILSDSHYLDSK